MKTKGWQYKVHRCTVCGKEAFHGTQARPLCYSCEKFEKDNHLDHCCDCGAVLKNVPTEWQGMDDLLCVDCEKVFRERVENEKR